MSAATIIPARYQSSRFPGKPLAILAGKPMVQWVWEAATRSTMAAEVLIATDDERISEVATGSGAKVVMTSAEHRTGTDRVAAVASMLHHQLIVNLQGDEPLTNPRHLDALISRLTKDEFLQMATLATPASASEADDPNCVKVVLDSKDCALCFSRAKISHIQAEFSPTQAPLSHIGIYAFRAEFLQQFSRLPRTPNEVTESLEQLRALEHGYSIGVITVEEYLAVSVDTPADVEAAERILLSNRLI